MRGTFNWYLFFWLHELGRNLNLSFNPEIDWKKLLEQVQGLWKVKNENMSNLYEEVKKLKDKFVSFQINHVLRVGKVDSAYVYDL